MLFETAFTNVLITLLYIIPGFIAEKCKIVKAQHLSSMSAVLIYICAPCLVVNSFINTDFTGEGFWKMAAFFGVTLVLQAAFMFLLYSVLRKKYDDAKYRILTIASVLGNVGFFGLPIVKALLPEFPEVGCYSSVYIISMNMLVFTMGIYCLTKDKKYISLKSVFINPTVIALAVALPLYFFGVGKDLPEPLMNSISLLSSMTTPLCMIILGIRLATVSLKKLFTRPFVYAVLACKLIVFPLFCYFAVLFLPFDFPFKASVLILSAAPCASVIYSMAEIHNAEAELSANCMLISTLVSFITIPLITLVL